MPLLRQAMPHDPEFLRIMTENFEFQRIAAVRQWETLLAFPMLPVVGPAPAPVHEIVQINDLNHITT